MIQQPLTLKELEELITFTSVEDAQKAAKEIMRELKTIQSPQMKQKIYNIVNKASNLAKASAKRKNMTPPVAQKMRKIAKIYKQIKDHILLSLLKT